MNPSTKDEIKGTVHEVKGKSKRRQAKLRTILTCRPKATPKKTPAKLRKRSDRSKKCSRSKLGGLKRSEQVLPFPAEYW